MDNDVTNTDVVIPTDINCYKVVAIDDYAFNHESMDDFNIIDVELQSVTLPDSLVKIGKYAFNSNGLVEISFPDNVEAIGYGAFMSNHLQSLTLATTSDGECVATQSGHSSGSNANQDKFVGCIAQGAVTIDVNAFVDNHLNAAIVLSSVVNFNKAAFDPNVKITIK